MRPACALFWRTAARVLFHCQLHVAMPPPEARDSALKRRAWIWSIVRKCKLLVESPRTKPLLGFFLRGHADKYHGIYISEIYKGAYINFLSRTSPLADIPRVPATRGHRRTPADFGGQSPLLHFLMFQTLKSQSACLCQQFWWMSLSWSLNYIVQSTARQRWIWAWSSFGNSFFFNMLLLFDPVWVRYALF